MRVLVACEFSGVVRDAFTKRGHYAMSCDLLDTESPGLHYKGDVLDILNNDWDIVIAHPPCTYLSNSGNRHLNSPGRKEHRQADLEFFLSLYNTKCNKVCVENPVGYANSTFRQPDQIIHPWYFGDPIMKRTCLWLRGLPTLKHNKDKYHKPEPSYYKPDGTPRYWTNITPNRTIGNSGKARSITSWAIAEAMAEQWG